MLSVVHLVFITLTSLPTSPFTTYLQVTCLLTYLFAYLLIHLFVFLFFCLFVYLFAKVYLS